MISRDLRIDAIDPRHFAHLARLMDPPEGNTPAPTGSGAFGLLDRLTGTRAVDSRSSASAARWLHPVIVLVRGGKVVRLARLGGGTMSLASLGSSDPAALRAFRQAQGLPFVAALDIDRLPRLWADAQAAVRLDDDYACQLLAMLRVFRQAVTDGEVLIDPPIFGALPLPTFDLLQRTFDRVLPDGRSFVFYIVDRARVWTSLIVVKRGGDVREITTHEAIAKEVNFTSIRGDAGRVIQAVGRRLAPAHIGIFLPLASWHRFVHGDRSAIARAISARQALLDPCPPWLLALVGAGAVTEAANRSAKLAGRLLSRSKLLSSGAERLIQTAANPLEILGIDPWEMLSWSREWSRRLLPLL